MFNILFKAVNLILQIMIQYISNYKDKCIKIETSRNINLY